ncbi:MULTISPECIES: FAD-dependent oxidoreductase [unclassified Mesorhizobium]|uniref:FAD-dependent oxidoreductase n=1 Tax=unclassified Mesorhizobium TaxID=325217 RepID=UPI000FD90725|nr:MULTISPECIES: FAD-dependent oxidoreductase [unclassified Mesorhizobium]TGT71906.1 FAD-binding protein [Mesorhizobium sp. M2E.F.Ca.ET.166.01.1.1]TGV99379.1 FAD-binding protein [Mesorhizobium sp. M2E.F.Ca.ET.154.01.1.1]
MLDPAVLVVGAGPAGLAAAAEMVRRGVRDVLVIDRDDAPGGLPRFCSHPGFGLGYLAVPRSGPGFVKSLLRPLESSQVRILCGTSLISLDEGPVATVTGPELGYRTLRPRAIILATGIREASRGNRLVPGDRPAVGVLTTGLLQQMVARQVPFPAEMKSLVVVGTEHVSFSTVLTARHAGLKVRMMVEEKPRISSYRPMTWLARLSAIDIRLKSRIAAIKGTDNRVSGVEVECNGAIEIIPCDGVVFTAGWIPEVSALLTGPTDIDAATGGLAVNEQNGTGLPGVYSAGNVLHPLKASGSCARQGRRVGRVVAGFLSTVGM